MEGFATATTPKKLCTDLQPAAAMILASCFYTAGISLQFVGSGYVIEVSR